MMMNAIEHEVYAAVERNGEGPEVAAALIEKLRALGEATDHALNA